MVLLSTGAKDGVEYGMVFAALLIIMLAAWTTLLLAIPIAMLGFGIGHLFSPTTATSLLEIGQLHVIEGTAGAWLALAAVGILQR